MHLASLLRNTSPCSRRCSWQMKKSMWKTWKFKWIHSNQSHSSILSHILCAHLSDHGLTVTCTDTSLCYVIYQIWGNLRLNHKWPHQRSKKVLNPNRNQRPHLEFKPPLPSTQKCHHTLHDTNGWWRNKTFPKRRKKNNFSICFTLTAYKIFWFFC